MNIDRDTSICRDNMTAIKNALMFDDAELGYKRPTSENSGLLREFKIVKDFTKKDKAGFETGNIVYLRVALFITNNIHIIKKDSSLSKSLKDLPGALENRIKKNDTIINSRINRIFRRAKVKACREQNVILRDIKTIFENINAEKEQKIEEKPKEIKHRARKKEEQGVPSKFDIISRQNDVQYEVEDKEGKTKTVKMIKEVKTVEAKQTQQAKEKVVIDSSFGDIPPPPPFGDIPPPPSPASPRVTRLKFVNEPNVPNIAEKQDLTKIDNATIQQQIKTITKYLESMEKVIKIVKDNTDEIEKLEADIKTYQVDIANIEAKLTRFKDIEKKLVSDEKEGLPQTVLYQDEKTTFEFYSKSEFERKKKSLGLHDNQLRSKAIGRVSELIKSSEKEKIEQVKALKQKTSELKSKICNPNVLSKEDIQKRIPSQDQNSETAIKQKEALARDIEAAIKQKEALVRQWKTERKKREDKLSGRKPVDFKSMQARKMQENIENGHEVENQSAMAANKAKSHTEFLQYLDCDRLFTKLHPDLAEAEKLNKK